MKIMLFLIAMMAAFVLWNEAEAPENVPWESVAMPKTEKMCLEQSLVSKEGGGAVKRVWKKAYSSRYPFSIDAPHEAHCQLIYADEGRVCRRPADCGSHVCVVHPVTRKASCSGYLPPRGRFEFLDARGWVRDAKLPL